MILISLLSRLTGIGSKYEWGKCTGKECVNSLSALSV